MTNNKLVHSKPEIIPERYSEGLLLQGIENLVGSVLPSVCFMVMTPGSLGYGSTANRSLLFHPHWTHLEKDLNCIASLGAN